MIITAEQLAQLALAGGGLQLDASAWTFNQIRDIAAAAMSGQAKVTLKSFGDLTAVQLGELAALAPGLITFDFTS
jgi:hypothetical protein